MSITLTETPRILELELTLELMRDSLYRAERQGEDPLRIEQSKEDIYQLMETLDALQAGEHHEH